MKPSDFSSPSSIVIVFIVWFNRAESTADVSRWCVDDVTNYNPYQSALSYVNSSTIGLTQLQTIIDDAFARAGCYWLQATSSVNLTCSGCLTASDIYTHHLRLRIDEELTSAQFDNVSIVITAFLYRLTTFCSSNNHLNWSALSYSNFVDELKTVPSSSKKQNVTFSSDQLEQLMRSLSTNYIPGDQQVSETPTTRNDISMLCAVGNIMSFSSTDVMNATNPTNADGLQENEMGRMSSIIVTKMLNGDCITPVHKGVPQSDQFLKSIFNSYGSQDQCSFDLEGLKRLYQDLGVDTTHSNQQSRRRRRDVTGQTDVAAQLSNCLTVEEVLESYDINQASITRFDFFQVSPAIMQQAAIGCKQSTSDTSSNSLSTAKLYGVSTVAVLLISVVPLIGLIIVKFQHFTVYKYLLVIMLGLAVGTLTADAFLHLIPQALGVDSEDSSGTQSDGISVKPYVWKMLVGCLSVWMFFVLQLSLQWLNKVVEHRKSLKNETKLSQFKKSSMTSVVVTDSAIDQTTDSVADDNSTNAIDERRHSIDCVSTASHSSLAHVHGSVAWMVTIGDGLHNFTDGLALGASFSNGLNTGISTSIAVLCHEIPHEFGDAAILLTAGWSPLKIAIFHSISQLTAFVGLYIGISVSSTSDTAQQWILAVATGIFVYVALSDVLPELLSCFERYRPLPTFIASNAGILFGFLVMLLMAIFEEQIKIGS